MQKIKFNLKLEEETVKQLKNFSIEEGRTISGMARKIIEDYYKSKLVVEVIK